MSRPPHRSRRRGFWDDFSLGERITLAVVLLVVWALGTAVMRYGFDKSWTVSVLLAPAGFVVLALVIGLIAVLD